MHHHYASSSSLSLYIIMHHHHDHYHHYGSSSLLTASSDSIIWTYVASSSNILNFYVDVDVDADVWIAAGDLVIKPYYSFKTINVHFCLHFWNMILWRISNYHTSSLFLFRKEIVFLRDEMQPRTQALFCAPSPADRRERRKEPGYEVGWNVLFVYPF